MERLARRNPGKVPLINPFAQMGLKSSDRKTPTATYEDLQAFRAKAVEMGLPSLATAALISWEWLQREVRYFRHLRCQPLPTEGKAERCSHHPRQDQRRKLDAAVRLKPVCRCIPN